MCDRPLRGFKIGYTRKGKPNYLICSPDVDYIYSTDNDKWIKGHGKVPKSLYADYITEYVTIPCGSCMSCRITRAAEMADRCVLEAGYHKENCYITLTYDDDHLIKTNYYNPDTGECGESNTLFKKHYQDFIKRLRKAFPDNDIRYVLCGEYGDLTQRAHYHAILFGYCPKDLVKISVNHRGQPLYNSEELRRIWRNGNVIVGEVTRDSCNYVARYVTKKLYGKYSDDQYKYKARIKPFIVSSKRPGIARRWYEDNKEWCFENQISYATPDGGHSFNAPRYFKKLRELDNELTEDKKMFYNEVDDINVLVKVSQDKNLINYNDMRREEIADIKERRNKVLGAIYTRDKI